jgi:hypothetical protein
LCDYKATHSFSVHELGKDFFALEHSPENSTVHNRSGDENKQWKHNMPINP